MHGRKWDEKCLNLLEKISNAGDGPKIARERIALDWNKYMHE